jgi:hypothetical protein
MSIKNQLEFVDDLLDRNDCDPYFKKENQKKVLADEAKVDELFFTYWKNSTLSIEVKEEVLWKYPFIFPSNTTGAATTSFPTILRFSFIPALCVEYYSNLEEIPVPNQFKDVNE